MKSTLSIQIGAIALIATGAILGCTGNSTGIQHTDTTIPSVSDEELENQVWNMEQKYWDYVEKNDTVAYKKLWHDKFIGYPSFGNGVSGKSGIASWIPELHKDTSLVYSSKLHKKAVNAIDDVVMAFYDADEIWTDKLDTVVRQETFKFTHTWKKYDGNWLILGGMAAKKTQ